MIPKDIPIVVYWSEKEQCFLAKPELAIAGAHGNTRLEAIQLAETLIEAWFEIRKEQIWKPHLYVQSTTGPTPAK